MSGTSARATILVADDDGDIREYVRFLLQREGYVVLAAEDGEQALRLAIERQPDLAVLDARMPKLDGFAVTRLIRRHEVLGEMPVILLSALSSPEDVAWGLEAGANEYLTKPLNTPEELLTQIRETLGR